MNLEDFNEITLFACQGKVKESYSLAKLKCPN